MQILYTNEGKELSDAAIAAALRSLGVNPGDTIIVHSDSMVFGRPQLASVDDFLRGLSRIFTDAVGTMGTVVMPTFTYSFGRKEPFDRQRSPSRVGSLTEFFRHEPNVLRTLHPMHSVAIWGARQEEFMAINKDTFGTGTIFDKLHEAQAKIVLFGVDLNACTFLHYIEQMHMVPYRFVKQFTGTVIDEGRSYEDWCTYYARKLEEDIDNDMMRLAPTLREKNLIRETRVGRGQVWVIEAEPLFAAGMDYLDRDPRGLVAL